MRGILTVEATLTEVAGRLERGDPKTHRSAREVTLFPRLREELAAHIAAYSDPKDPDAFISEDPTRRPVVSAARYGRTNASNPGG